MDTLRGGAALDTLPRHVRDELIDVDRLRLIRAQHRQGLTRDARGVARRELNRRRVRELGGSAALAALVDTTSSEELSGQPVTADHVAGLAEAAADLPPEGTYCRPSRPLNHDEAQRLADATAVHAHPVVRAAHVYAECVAVLRAHDPPDGSGTPGTPPVDQPWALPWVLASLVLHRADVPPVLPDPLTPPPPWSGRDLETRFADLVEHLARLVTRALRDELSRNPEGVPAPRAPIPPLAAVTRRRVVDYVRDRREPVSLILRALAPDARTAVYSGGSDQTSPESPAGEPAARTILTPGAAHWWTALELVVGEASLTLFVVVQEVGLPRTGVLAVTADARLTTPDGVRDALNMSGTDSVTVMPTDCVDDRWPQVRDLVDEAVSRAMNELTRV